MQEIILEPNEKWIPGFEGFYSLTEDGKCYSYLGKVKREKTVTVQKKVKHSYRIALNDKTYNYLILLAKTFLPNPSGSNTVKLIKEDEPVSINNIKWEISLTSEKEKIMMIYYGMKQRCYNKNNPSYKNYGGRGITISDNWRKSFDDFYRDMGDRPSKYHSIDRIDNKGNYCKENCKWSSKIEQNNNRRNNKMIKHHGENKTLQEWANIMNIGRSAILNRLRRGWTIEKALDNSIDNTCTVEHYKSQV